MKRRTYSPQRTSLSESQMGAWLLPPFPVAAHNTFQVIHAAIANLVFMLVVADFHPHRPSVNGGDQTPTNTRDANTAGKVDFITLSHLLLSTYHLTLSWELSLMGQVSLEC
jgi:hypothetical protein